LIIPNKVNQAEMLWLDENAIAQGMRKLPMTKTNISPSKAKVRRQPSYFDVIPDFYKFIETDDQLLTFPLSISQLAKTAQTTVHTVRNYVAEGLLNCSEKTKSGYGLYDQCALTRLRLIRAARAAGLLILEIKPLLQAINAEDRKACDEAVRLLRTKIAEKQTYLHSLDKQLCHLEQLDKPLTKKRSV
jgi:MerR family mercuric resistance operon transcriptional regulator